MSEGQPIGNELTSEHGIEEVAKGLAQGTVSRRRALGALGGILGGGLLAALIPGVARAQPPGFPGRSFFPFCCREFQQDQPEAFAERYRNRGQCVRAREVDCEECPDTCAEGPPNGNNGECEYHQDRECLNECPEGTVRTLSADGSESTCEDDTGLVA